MFPHGSRPRRRLCDGGKPLAVRSGGCDGDQQLAGRRRRPRSGGDARHGSRRRALQLHEQLHRFQHGHDLPGGDAASEGAEPPPSAGPAAPETAPADAAAAPAAGEGA